MILGSMMVGVLFAGWNTYSPSIRPVLPPHVTDVDSQHVRRMGDWPFGLPFSVAVDSLRHLVFLGSGCGVWILDVSDPSSPQKLGEIRQGMDIVDGLRYDEASQRLYVAGGELKIVDVQNPYQPQVLSVFHTPDVALDVDISGGYAFVADGNRTLAIDVSDPYHPQGLGMTSLMYAEDLDVSGSYLYIAGFMGDLRVVDASDPAQLVEVGSYAAYNVQDVEVSGTYAYIVAGYTGLHILDISTPTSPTAVGIYGMPAYAFGVAVHGSYAYIADGDSGLRIFDVSNAASAVEVGSYPIIGQTRDVVVAGSLAYVVSTDGLHILDIQVPSAPVEVGFFAVPYIEFGKVAVSGSYAVVTGSYSSHLSIMDVGNPTFPVWMTTYTTPGVVYDMQIVGTYLYIANGDQGVRILDIGDPSQPLEVGVYNSPGPAYAIAVADSYLYVAEGDSGMRIVDIQTPAAPLEVGAILFPSPAFDVAVSGNHVDVATADGFRVVDVSNPANPVEVGFRTGIFVVDMAVSGGYTYAVINDNFGYSGISVMDVNDPTQPVEVAFIASNPSYTIEGVAIGGSLLSYVEGGWGVKVVDVSSPSTPVSVGYYRTPGVAHDVAAEGPYVYVADGYGGLQVLTYQGTNVKEVAGTTQRSEWRVRAVGGRLQVVAEHKGRLQIWSALGRKVWEGEVNAFLPLTISTRRWPRGVYVVRWVHRGGTAFKKVMLVQ